MRVRTSVIAGIAVAGLASASAIAVSSQGTSMSETGTPAPTVTVSATSHDSELGESQQKLGVLVRGRTDRDALPAEAATAIAANPYAPDPTAVRLARQSADGTNLYVAPGRANTVCLLTALGGGGCSGADSVANGELNGYEQCAGPAHNLVVINGIVPNGVGTVHVDFADGASDDVKVEGNVYSLGTSVASSVPVRVTWDGGSSQTGLERAPAPRCAG